MEDPKVILQKLTSLLDVAAEKLSTTEMDDKQKSKLHFSLACYVQLVAQIKQLNADMRDDAFATAGSEATEKDLTGLKEALNFADWAYDEKTSVLRDHLEGVGFSLLHHDLTKKVGCVGHYIAINPSTKVAMIGIKGSSSFEDLLTDLCALSVDYELEKPFVKDGGKSMRCHEGILESAKKLAEDTQVWIEHLFLPLKYKIVFCGHSLGAGAASLVAPILRSKLPALQKDGRMEVVAFACPPVMDHDTALACAPFTTTIVNNSDCIPRSSLANLEVLVECLVDIYKKLVEKEIITDDDWGSTLALFKKLREGTDGEMLMSAEEARQMVKEAQEDVQISDPHHLYVPGRVLIMYEPWKKQVEEEAGEGEEGQEVTIEKVEATVEKLVQDAEKKEGDSQEGNEPKVPSVILSRVADGTASVLRLIEVDERMVSDHFTESYHASVDALKPPEKKKEDPCNIM